MYFKKIIFVFLTIFLKLVYSQNDLLVYWKNCSLRSSDNCELECIGNWANSKLLNASIIDTDIISFPASIGGGIDDMKFAKISCRSNEPIDFVFDGIKPQTQFIIRRSTVQSQNNLLFNMTVSFPVRDFSTGFYKMTSKSGIFKQLYIYFERSTHPYFLEYGKILNTIKQDEDDTLIFPCKLTNPGEKDKIKLAMIYPLNELISDSDLSYDSRVGFKIKNNERWLFLDISQTDFKCFHESSKDNDFVEILRLMGHESTQNPPEEHKGSKLGFKLGTEYNRPKIDCIALNGTFIDSIIEIFATNPTESDLMIIPEEQNINYINFTGQENIIKHDCNNQRKCSVRAIYKTGYLMCISTKNERIQVKFFTGFDNRIHDYNFHKSDLSSGLRMEILPREKNEKLELSYLYTKSPFLFHCFALKYFYLKPLTISINFDDNSTMEVPIKIYEGVEVEEDLHKITFSVNLLTNMTEIICSAYSWNSETPFTSSLKIVVREKFKPKFKELQKDFDFPKNEKTPYMLCQAEGVPIPKINWDIPPNDDLYFHNHDRKGWEVLTYLNFKDLSKSESAGVYPCKATNIEGDEIRNHTVNIIDPPDLGPIIGGVIGGIILLIIILTIAIIWVIYYRKEKLGLTKEEIYEFVRGKPLAGKNIHENTDYISYDHRLFELDKEKFEIDRDKILGQGAFGLVFAGKVENQIVAIKTIKPLAEKQYLKSLLSELKIMIYIGNHPNIVNLIGAYTHELKDGIAYVFVEFCNLGSLEVFLRINRQSFTHIELDKDDVQAPSTYENLQSEFSTVDLLLWSYQLACGMEYLASKKVIHGDLASRNVLLLDKKQVKITDFGLSRKIYDYTNYVKKNEEPLPWRWMAIESLKNLEFSTQSDIWSFGVTCWFFSLGDVPYPGCSWTIDFVEKLANDFRMIKPIYASKSLYSLMLECWNIEPKARPSFETLKNYFRALYEDIKDK